MSAIWHLARGTIRLLTPEELSETPDGTTLVCINGTEVVVGRDRIDGDTRGGYLAYGLPDSDVVLEMDGLSETQVPASKEDTHE